MVPAPPRSSALAVALALALSGCITRPAKVDVYSENGIEIFLRSEIRGFSPIEKGFSHPVTIAPVRIAHVLARIDLSVSRASLLSTNKEESRVPAIQTDMLFPIAEGVSEALARADENQEVVVMAQRRTKRWGVFDHDFLTSFLVYVRDERLYLHMGQYEWEVPKRREERLPEPHVGSHPLGFRVRPGTAMSLVDRDALAIDWRDPIFARATRTAILPGGDVVRKTILLESPPEAGEPESSAALPEDLTPNQLRDLADVEEARREGRITETEYRARRREILGVP